MVSETLKALLSKHQHLVDGGGLKTSSDFTGLIIGSHLNLRSEKIAGLRWEEIDHENFIVTVIQLLPVPELGAQYCVKMKLLFECS